MIDKGDEVVCICDLAAMPHWRRRFRRFGITPPTKGQTYKVRNVFDMGGRVYVLLQEIANPFVLYDLANKRFEAGFPFWAFRKITKPEHQTEQSVMDRFTKGADKESEQWDNRRVKVPA